jgi:hypothetical protein
MLTLTRRHSMSIYHQIYNTFIELLGEPSLPENLDIYISFVLENETSKAESNNYCEDHHIIPNCLLSNDLTITLEYPDHVEAHLLLAKAYPISIFVRPLNYMLNREDKKSRDYRRLHSEAIKTWWKEFRKSENYDKWVKSEKRREYLTSEANIRHINEVMVPASLKIMNDPIRESKRIEAIKKSWTDEKRQLKSISMIEYNKIHGTDRYKEALTKRWNEMDEESRKNFSQKMTIVNNDEHKKEKARKTMNVKWETDMDYREKMSNRAGRTKEGIERTAKIVSELWKNEDYKSEQLRKRKIAAIKKKCPEHLKEVISIMSDDELIEKFGYLSVKPYTKTPNTELKNRTEVKIIKAFKSKRWPIIDDKKNDPKTGRGWYRKNTNDLHEIIKTFVAKYGIIPEFKKEIEGIMK